MAEPIKHAPGVVCIISTRGKTGHPLSLQARAHNNGRVCTIVGPAAKSFQRDGGVTVTPTYIKPDDIAWLVRSETPLALVVVNPIQGRRLVFSSERVFLQTSLIPIAGPGIDVSETTSVETPVPAQSPVPETT